MSVDRESCLIALIAKPVLREPFLLKEVKRE
jgi:hypothetical protein